MTTIRSLSLMIACSILIGGCATGPFAEFRFGTTAGAPYLEEGIRQYEEGNYRVAARRLQFGLEEGLSRDNRVLAHKYLAFIACISGQELTCREEFEIALYLDPTFELGPAEIGHPIWGPVYQNVKARQKR
ncbi:MAG: TssQ family T6SS-associated lipoprotein [Burkholderiales bacterium]